MIWRGDHDCHATALESGKKVLAHPVGEFVVVPVKQDGRRITARIVNIADALEVYRQGGGTSADFRGR